MLVTVWSIVISSQGESATILWIVSCTFPHKPFHRCGHEIDEQFKRLGASLDWSRPNFTMSEVLSIHQKTINTSLHPNV